MSTTMFHEYVARPSFGRNKHNIVNPVMDIFILLLTKNEITSDCLLFLYAITLFYGNFQNVFFLIPSMNVLIA